MPIKIPPGSKIHSDARLSLLCAIELLAARAADQKRELREEFKRKKIKFAGSELALAMFKAAAPGLEVVPRKFFALAKKKKLTPARVERCVRINQTPLAEFLSEREIKSISKKAKGRDQLPIELKPGLVVKVENLLAELEKLLKSTAIVAPDDSEYFAGATAAQRHVGRSRAA